MDVASDYFFPKGSLDAERDDRFLRVWYSNHLDEMHEPSLSCGAAVEAYRFTWLRTFHHPVAVRVTRTSTTGRSSIIAVELDGAGGFDPGKEYRRLNREMSDLEFRSFIQALDHEKLWYLSSLDERPGLDGSEWILEARKENRYHIVKRWSPESGPVRNIGELFLTVSGWAFGPVY